MRTAAALSLLLTALAAAALFLAADPIYVRSAWVGSTAASSDDGVASTVLKNVQDATRDAYQSASEYAGKTGDGIRQAGATVADKVSGLVSGAGGAEEERIGCGNDAGVRSLLDRAAEAVKWRSASGKEQPQQPDKGGLWSRVPGLGGGDKHQEEEEDDEEVTSWAKAKEKMAEARRAAAEAARHVKQALFHRSSKGAHKVQETSGSYAEQASETGARARDRARDAASSTYASAQDRAYQARDAAQSGVSGTLGRAADTLSSAKDATYSTLQDARARARDTVGSTYSAAQDAAARGTGAAYDAVGGAYGAARDTAAAAYDRAGSAGAGLYEAAADRAGAAYEGVSGAAGSAYDSLYSAIEILADSLRAAPGLTGEYAGSASDRIGTATQSMRDAITGTGRDVYDRAAGEARDAASRVPRPDVGQARKNASDAAGAVKDKATQVGGLVRDNAGDAADFAKGSLPDDIITQVPTGADQIKDRAAETAGAAKDRAAETAGAAKDKAADTAGAARDTAYAAKDKASDAAGAAVGHVKDKLTGTGAGTDLPVIPDVHQIVEKGLPPAEDTHKEKRSSGGPGSSKNLVPDATDSDDDEGQDYYAWLGGAQSHHPEGTGAAHTAAAAANHAAGSARDVAATAGATFRDAGRTIKDKTIGSGKSSDPSSSETEHSDQSTTGEQTALSGPQGPSYLDSVGPVTAAAASQSEQSLFEDKSPRVVHALPAGGLFTSLARLLHLAAFAFSFGTSVWMTFLSGGVLAQAVPRHQFGHVQSRLFPAYLKAAAVGQAITFLVHWTRHPWSGADAAERLQFVNLCFTLAANIINIFYLEPQVSRIMFERLKLEKDEDGGLNGKNHSGDKTRTAELARNFNILHGYSSLVNLLSLAGQTWQLWYLSRRLVI